MKNLLGIIVFSGFLLNACGSVRASDGPLVLIVADSGAQGPAGVLACDQIKHWTLSQGQLVVIADPFEAMTQIMRNQLSPDWVIVLKEDFDDWRSLSHADGHVLQTYRVDAKHHDMLRNMANAAERLDEETNHKWKVSELQEDIAKRFEVLIGDKGSLVVVNTSSKDPSTNRIHKRIREHRHVVHGFLRSMDLMAEESSPEQMTAARGSETRQPISFAIFDGPGAVSSSGHGPDWVLQTFRADTDMDSVLIGPDEIRAGALEQFDVVLFGGGLSTNQAIALEETGKLAVQKFVRNGGGYVGICAGAFLASCNKDSFLHIINAKMPRGSGKAVVPVDFTEVGSKMLQVDGKHPAQFSGGPGLTENAGMKDLPDFEVLARYRADAPKTKLKGAPAILCSDFGKGRVIVFSPHCERSPGPRDSFLQAVRWATGVVQASNDSTSKPETKIAEAETSSTPVAPVETLSSASKASNSTASIQAGDNESLPSAAPELSE